MRGKSKVIEFLQGASLPARLMVPTRAEASATESKFFGRPWMEVTKEWPQDETGEALEFVMQIELAQLPNYLGLPSSGLLTYFFSADDDAVLMVQDTSKRGGPRWHPDNELQPEYVIRDFIEVRDVPHFGDVTEHLVEEGLDEDDVEEAMEQIFGDEIGMVMVGKKLMPEADAARQSKPYFACFRTSKIGGWPYWEQGNEAPVDANGDLMLHALQINAYQDRQNLDEMPEAQHAGCGVAHIWYSPTTGEWKHEWSCD